MRLGASNWDGCELVVPRHYPTFAERVASPEAPANPDRPSRADDDDGLDDLPPLDGEVEEAPPTEPDLGGFLDDDSDETVSLDDATAENEPIDASDLQLPEETGGLEGAGDAAELELGELVLGGFAVDDAPIGEDDRPAEDAAVHDDDAMFHDGGGETMDVGEEGPLDDEDEVSESRLPDIDADEDDRNDDAPPLPLEEEPSGLPWAAEPWTRVGAPWPVGDATAVACLGRGAIVVGRSESGVIELTRVDLEGACQSVAASGVEPGHVRSLTAAGETVVAKTQDGGLFVSADGGSTFTPAEADGSRSLGELPPGALPSPSAVRGSLVSYGGRKSGIVRGGKGQEWSSIAWDGKVTAITFIDDTGTVAAATYSAADDTTDLVRVSPGGAAVVVARIGAARVTSDSDGRVAAMAYDDARGVLWVVGGFGVAAFAGR
jgi:hypothetical protein